MDKKLLGIDLGGTTVKYAILTEAGEIQQKWSIETNILDDGSHIVPDIIDSINHHLSLYGMTPEQFIGIGMGTPGSVDIEAGTVIGAYNLNWTTLQHVKSEIGLYDTRNWRWRRYRDERSATSRNCWLCW